MTTLAALASLALGGFGVYGITNSLQSEQLDKSSSVSSVQKNSSPPEQLSDRVAEVDCKNLTDQDFALLSSGEMMLKDQSRINISESPQENPKEFISTSHIYEVSFLGDHSSPRLYTNHTPEATKDVSDQKIVLFEDKLKDLVDFNKEVSNYAYAICVQDQQNGYVMDGDGATVYNLYEKD